LARKADLFFLTRGINHDMVEFVVNSIHRSLEKIGQELYLATDQLMNSADGVGSNGSPTPLWKVKLTELAYAAGLTLAERYPDQCEAVISWAFPYSSTLRSKWMLATLPSKPISVSSSIRLV
jgi:hypothetical protein